MHHLAYPPLLMTVSGLLLLACGASSANITLKGHHYNATVIRHAPLKPNQKRAIIADIIPRLSGLTLVVISNKKKRKVKPSKTTLGRLSLAMLGGIRIALMSSHPGAEMDLMVRVKGQYPTPVQVLWNLDQTLWVEAGDQTTFAPQKEGPIGLRFQAGSGRWASVEKAHVRAAIKRLNQAERKVVRNIPLIRERNKRKTGWAKGGLYEQKGCFARIRMYSHAFAGRHLRFSGDPNRPLAKTTATILHEVAHAFHHAPSRRAYCELERRTKTFEKRRIAYNQRIKGTIKAISARETRKELRWLDAERKRLDALLKKADTLSRKGPVLIAYEKVLNGRLGPTVYGASALEESFAEAFALFHADKAALTRIWPDVAAWFKRGGHLERK